MVRRILPLVQTIGHAARSRRAGPTAHRSVFKIDVGHLLLKHGLEAEAQKEARGKKGVLCEQQKNVGTSMLL